ncbi:MAG: hypothetical protein ACJ8M1_07310 [Chthoniobacterales bacterium]
MSNRHPLLAGFFVFGALMCGLTLFLLTFPGTELDQLWRLNPEARRAFGSLGWLSKLLMTVVGVACGMCAVGLWRGRRWGVLMAMTILSVNIAGDLFNALGRGDYRSLIGLPVGGAMIFYLGRSNRRLT